MRVWSGLYMSGEGRARSYIGRDRAGPIYERRGPGWAHTQGGAAHTWHKRVWPVPHMTESGVTWSIHGMFGLIHSRMGYGQGHIWQKGVANPTHAKRGVAHPIHSRRGRGLDQTRHGWPPTWQKRAWLGPHKTERGRRLLHPLPRPNFLASSPGPGPYGSGAEAGGTRPPEKPFKCQLCQSAFRYKGNLASHHTIHTGTEPGRGWGLLDAWVLWEGRRDWGMRAGGVGSPDAWALPH